MCGVDACPDWVGVCVPVYVVYVRIERAEGAPGRRVVPMLDKARKREKESYSCISFPFQANSEPEADLLSTMESPGVYLAKVASHT